MFKIFNKNKEEALATRFQAINPFATNVDSPTVEQIHKSFYEEVDALLEEAKVSKSTDTDKQALIDKCKKLKALGFTSTKEVLEAQSEIERLNAITRENSLKQNLVNAINYFSNKYPSYKFITEDSVKKICAKYGLVYSNVSNYIGTVPDKNLKHIENFKIDSLDEAYLLTTLAIAYRSSGSIDKQILNKEICEIEKKRLNTTDGYYTQSEKLPLEIAAPLKDFNVKNLVLENFELKNKPPQEDPIVLCPVHYNGKKHYLIVTAWGDEASDELVLNQNLN